MATLADPPPSAASQPKITRLRLWLLIAAGLVVLAGAGVFGWRMYSRIREDSVVEKARTFLEKKDYGQALIAAQWALRMSPRSVEANRIMADLADLAGSSQAVFWHRAVAELEPGVPAHYLKWAEAGLQSNNLPMVEQALAGIPEAARSTAAYHEIAGRLAQVTGKPADAESHFAEAAKLEPANEKYRFGLVTARLGSPDPATRDQARAVIEEFRNRPDLRQRAHYVLIQDHFSRSEWKEGFLLAADLQAIPNAPFEDRMLLLDLLRKFNRPELHSYLMDVQTVAARNPEHAAALVAWMNRNTMALIAADWAKSLPAEIRAHNPVPSAIAESYANLRDWKKVRQIVEEGNWEYTDFMRLALLARALREEGDPLASRNAWNAAVKGAGNRADSLDQLARFAKACGWQSESIDILWQIVRGKSNQQPALAALQVEYAEARNARGLLNVALRRLELTSGDAAAQSDVAALSMLLNVNMDRAQTLARTAFTAQPATPAVAATYAYALHLMGKTEEGLKVMRSLDPALLQKPEFAANYGILLAEAGPHDEAARYLDLAKTGRLLPEEQELIVKAKARLDASAGRQFGVKTP